MLVDAQPADLEQPQPTGRGLQLDLKAAKSSFLDHFSRFSEGNAALGAVQKALLWLQAAQILRLMRRRQLAYSKITCNAPSTASSTSIMPIAVYNSIYIYPHQYFVCLIIYLSLFESKAYRLTELP